MMKSEKLKRNFWVSAEIECMLDLIKEVNKCQGALSTSTTQYTFVQIANQMKKRGFPNKSPTQIRRKWFQMKSAYLCYKKGNVDRLFLIPEKFRNVIAQFVESGEKIGRSNLSTISTGNPPLVQQSQEEEDTSVMDKFLNQIRRNNKMINSEYIKMEESLQQFEQKCQFIRDRNLIRIIDSY
ncbi:uncharacterized protein LOC108111188 [Drosophila eugracilis]|uniref:uncharacterized protein LOC108111188 n=1 Tax=Drosophila eugracilis TaxID=29029 RepID=UPI001BDA4601|nr:uncharacterized protein LOC108111188 [Drosophila eugracilis]